MTHRHSAAQAVAALLFGLIEGFVGAGDQAFQAVPGLHLRQADGGRHPRQDADGRVERRHLLQAFAQALTDTAALLVVDAGQQDHELFAAIAGETVLEAQLLALGVDPKLDVPEGRTEFRALTDTELKTALAMIDAARF